ncbi:hypothetical protein H0E87_006251 [Populus deltoides]|uniref:Response regulatory domain-containing protein n=1 Tax=Populus deltoides TaxID=3696 RepID=A0A8T2Z6F1_POPDE|nr:hypothetical protein H0E87_006251 [Populus deltoides]
MNGTYHTLIEHEISHILEQLSFCLGNFSQRMNESPKARREVIQIIREGARKTSQESSTHMLMADETSQVYYNLESTVAELNDYITETGRKMIASANVFTEGIEELKKNREESLKLFSDLVINMRGIGRGISLLEARKKIAYVNRWLKERTVVVDETMKEEHSATGFDQTTAPGREQDVLGLGNGSEEDAEGSRKEKKPGHEEVKSSSQGSSSTASDKFSVLLVEYESSDRLFNNTQIIEFGREYNLGMEVKVAKSGEKAIYLHSQGASFDLILMDMDMPAHVTSGYEVTFKDVYIDLLANILTLKNYFMEVATTQLRSLFGVESNIVGLTYTSESEEINEFIRAGHLNGCIGKPLTDEKIDSLIPIPEGNNLPKAGRQRTALSMSFMI